MKKYIFLTLIVTISIFNNTKAQIAVPVNLQSGQPIVNIPIYTVTSGSLSVPVSLNYTAGLQVSMQNGNDDYNVGVGWSLIAGGEITRTVRSLPDDYQGTGGDIRMGWLYGTGAGIVS